ncbi:hypothetical protein [Cronobacter dublinensis]|uniref:hypothetical protein n=1 Tax=Cronobacter dublinensis TaxID=413497 RepID=UPI00300E6904
MSEISKERAQEIFLGNGPEPTAQEERELARIALDWLALRKERERAEPIYQERRFHVSGKKQIECRAEINRGAYQYLPEIERRIVYTAPPAPVVPDLSLLDSLAGEFLNNAMNNKGKVKETYTWCAHRMAETVRECRAAMLATPSSKKE